MKKYIFLVLLFCIIACKQPIDLQGFDSTTWKADGRACRGKRIGLLSDFEQKVKPKLKGLSEDQIIDALGKADRQELFRRNQKFYYYYIEAGKQCNDSLEQTARQIQIRFDGIGKVNEIAIIYH